MRRFITFRKLPGHAKTALIQAALLLGVLALTLRLFGLSGTLRGLKRVPRLRTTPSNAPETVATLAWAVGTASRASGIGTCLSRSLALHLLLARRSIYTQLRIGVRKDKTGITAHAWLERNGAEIGGATSAAYKKTAFPPVRITQPG